ncbi:Protein of unknown function [Staphylococcus pasteuri]|uniref:Phage protein n=1 Tax=Staphylococcus pasteuri TaxID=45972 RepID=A0ABY1H9H0_9STAP|nr:DUF1024 family protein [Staphylococcus pasteuri]KKI54750.1 Phage protein [Staphylococcus pasteuri]SFZ78591.1 Protein of unknown function [Staphylococcus pasteuri]
MTNREQIEQAVISAGAFNGDDTEALLSEVSKVYEKAQVFDEIVNAVDESANSYELVARIKLEVLKYQKLERGE